MGSTITKEEGSALKPPKKLWISEGRVDSSNEDYDSEYDSESEGSP